MSNLPNYFQSVTFNFEDLLIEIGAQKKLRFLQIGVYTGEASVYLLEKFRHIEDFILTDVDTWSRGDSKEMSELNFQEVEKIYLDRTKQARELGRLCSIKKTSDSFFANNDQKFNFVYIDGNHEPIQVLKDGLNAFECLEFVGILAFDDYLGATNKSPDDRPKFAVDLFLSLMGKKVEIVKSNYQIWLRKTFNP